MLLTSFCLRTVSTLLFTFSNGHGFYDTIIDFFGLPTPLDKTIKLWKVFEKTLKIVQETPFHHDGIMLRPSLPTSNDLGTTPITAGNLRLPKLTHHDTIIAAVPRKIYANGRYDSCAMLYISRHGTEIILHSSCLSHQLHIHQLGWRDIHISRRSSN